MSNPDLLLVIDEGTTSTRAIVFDQSFDRSKSKLEETREKLLEIHRAGGHGFYYNSHASFLFASKDPKSIRAIKERLVESGLPTRRLIALAADG